MKRTPLIYPIFVALVVSIAGCARCGTKGGTDGSRPSQTTPGKAIAIAPARAAYVTNNGSDSISVIDRDGDAVDTVPVDVDPDAREAPHHLAIDGARKTVFVALAFPPEASPEKKKKKDPHASHGNAEDIGRLARLDLGTLAVKETRDVDENPGDVVLTHDKKRVIVTHYDMKRAMTVAAKGAGSPATMFASVIVFDAVGMKKVGARPVCVAPHGITVTKDDKTAFVACYGSDELAVVDLSGDTFGIARHPLGASQGVPGVPRYGPYSATLSPDDSLVVIADLEGQDLRVFDRADKRFMEKTIPLSAKAFMPAFVDGRTLVVPLQAPDGVARVDVDLFKVEKRATYPKDVCGQPHAVRQAKDGRVYLVCEGNHSAPGSVLEIDPVTLAMKKRWQVGVYPDGIAFGDE